jgi:4-hydroxy-tetrahydrodipicolinate synthase
VNIQPATIVRLATDVENIVAVKDATGDLSQVALLLSMAQGKIDVYSGNDDQIVPILSLGGSGVISVLSNVAPKYTHDICQTYFDGDVKTSAKMQLDAIPLIKALFSEVNPIPAKAAMSMMGYCADVLRRPLTPMEDAHAAVLRTEMQKFGILE